MATDAGREGELIFCLVYHQCRCKKPFERLWISSMEDSVFRSEPFYTVQVVFSEFTATGERLKEKRLAEEMQRQFSGSCYKD